MRITGVPCSDPKTKFPACPGTEEVGRPASPKETSRSTSTAAAKRPNPDPKTIPIMDAMLTELFLDGIQNHA
jgi:hypothetical protein